MPVTTKIMPSFLSLWVILGAILSPGSSAGKGQNATESVPPKQRDLSNVFSGDQIRRVPTSAEKSALRDPHTERRQVDKLHIEPGQKSEPEGPPQLKKRLMEDFTMAKQKCVDILKRAAIQKQEKKAAQNLEKKTDEDFNGRANILETRESQREEKKVVQKLKEQATEDFIKAVMTCKDVPGLAVAVVSGQDSWTQGFGVQDLDKKTPVDTKTHFAIGSLTKAFTSALLAVALQESNKKGKKVTWQSTARSILGEDFKLTRRLEQNVTLEDLLSHRTGLMAADIMAVAGFPPYSRSQFISRLHFLPAVIPFRKHFHYNNWMYSLAGDISEHLLQNSWENLLKDHLLSPLGMDDALVVWDDVNVTSPAMARPYHKIRGSLVALDESLYGLRQGRAAGSLAVSADDMTKWMQFLLQAGVSPKSRKEMIRREFMKDMMTSHISFADRSDDVPVGNTVNGYGFGWLTGTYRGKKTVSHTGGWFGYKASLTLYPEDNTAVFVATSGPGTDNASDAYRAITFHLADIALGYTPWLKQTTACSPQLFGELAQKKGQKEEHEGEEKKEGKENEEQAEDEGNTTEVVSHPDNNESEAASLMKNGQRYVGTYSHPLFGDVVIKNSTLRYHGLELTFQKLEGALIPSQKGSLFHVRWTGKTEFYSMNNFDVRLSRLVFSSATGQPFWLILTGPSPDDYEELMFDRKT